MTRPAQRPTLTSILLRSVSFEALDYGLEVGVFSQRSSMAREAPSALGFLARVRGWLRLVFDGVFGTAVSASCELPADDAPLNRRFARRRRHKLPLARQACALSYHIFCRYGAARCQQWLYNRSLIGRICWCFMLPNKRLPIRATAMRQGLDAGVNLSCAAPLKPD